MSWEKVIFTMGLFAFALSAQSQDAKAEQPEVKSCGQLVSTRPGEGSVYRGELRNSDYDFSARVPAELTAWGGVAESAPFHGFTIFLDPKAESCIIFEVHIRVDESGAFARPSGAKSIMLGKAEGWQKTFTGFIGGVRFTNVSTTFSFRQTDQVDDGTILLVTSNSDAHATRAIYDSFVHSLRFGH